MDGTIFWSKRMLCMYKYFRIHIQIAEAAIQSNDQGMLDQAFLAMGEVRRNGVFFKLQCVHRISKCLICIMASFWTAEFALSMLP